jgi:hypothetical protein
MSTSFTEVQDLLKSVGDPFQRSYKGNQERISGMTEAGKMVWRLVADLIGNTDM